MTGYLRTGLNSWCEQTQLAPCVCRNRNMSSAIHGYTALAARHSTARFVTKMGHGVLAPFVTMLYNTLHQGALRDRRTAGARGRSGGVWRCVVLTAGRGGLCPRRGRRPWGGSPSGGPSCLLPTSRRAHDEPPSQKSINMFTMADAVAVQRRVACLKFASFFSAPLVLPTFFCLFFVLSDFFDSLLTSLRSRGSFLILSALPT